MPDFGRITQQTLLHQWAPPAVLINRRHEVLYFHGSTAKYLRQPPGEPTVDVFSLVREALGTKIRAALHRADHERQTVTLGGAKLKGKNGYDQVRITVHPLLEAGESDGLFLVVFEDEPKQAAPKPGEEIAADDTAAKQLEQELRTTREELQSTIEELESSNEELKASNEEIVSMNEELQSTNEELETSKEELQSLNEELNTLNNQLNEKVDELQEANDDLANLLATTELATIFLDTQLRIKRYTNAVAKLFNLIPTDVGRPLADLNRKFTDDQLLQDAQAVLDALTRVAREVQTASGEWYSRRALPYRTRDNRIEGVVITFVNITDLKRAEIDLREWNEGLEQRVADRTTMLRLLNDVAPAANNADSLDEAAGYVLRRVCEHNGWCFGHALLPDEPDSDLLIPVRTYYESPAGRFAAFRTATFQTPKHRGEGLAGRTFETGEAQWADDLDKALIERRARLATELGILTAAAFPILSGQDVVGVLEFFSDEPIEPTERLLESMASIGVQLGRVVERQRFQRDLGRILLSEQRRVGADLHDTVGQELAGLALMTERLAKKLREEKHPEADALQVIESGVRNAVEEVRRAVRGLLPLTRHADSFAAELKALVGSICDRVDVTWSVDCPPEVEFEDADDGAHLYRIISEAVRNAARHGRPSQITVRLDVGEENVVLEIRDDGVGIAETNDREGSGLQIMRHRARLIGGALDVRRGRQGGTVVTCTVIRERLLRSGHRET